MMVKAAFALFPPADQSLRFVWFAGINITVVEIFKPMVSLGLYEFLGSKLKSHVCCVVTLNTEANMRRQRSEERLKLS